MKDSHKSCSAALIRLSAVTDTYSPFKGKSSNHSCWSRTVAASSKSFTWSNFSSSRRVKIRAGWRGWWLPPLSIATASGLGGKATTRLSLNRIEAITDIFLSCKSLYTFCHWNQTVHYWAFLLLELKKSKLMKGLTSWTILGNPCELLQSLHSAFTFKQSKWSSSAGSCCTAQFPGVQGGDCARDLLHSDKR